MRCGFPQSGWEKIEQKQFYANSSRMDYRELSADDLDLLTPLLRSEETMQTLGGALSYEQTLDWLVDTLRRYQAEGCVGCSHLINQPAFPRLCAAWTYEQVGAERPRTVSSGMSCAASASAASASPRACCTRLSPCTPTRTAPSCRRMISQDRRPPLLPYAADRKSRPAFRLRQDRTDLRCGRIRTSRRRQNQKTESSGR